MSNTTTADNTISIGGKSRYYEPAPHDIDVANFRKVVTSRRRTQIYQQTHSSSRLR